MGEGVTMVKVIVPDVPPPGVGLKTVTEALPAVAMSLAGIVAVNWVALTKAVKRLAPFQRTTELEVKFVPVAVKVNPSAPAAPVLGEMDVRDGTGFGFWGGGEEEPPPPPPQLAKPSASAEIAAKAAIAVQPRRNVIRIPAIKSLPCRGKTCLAQNANELK
jgi:hypothetical protein